MTEKTFIHENLMRWIQDQMKKLPALYENNKIPMWVWMVIHLVFWAIGMVIVTVMYPTVLLVEAAAKFQQEHKKETMTKGQVVV